jgi:hypothetical protein
MLFDEVSRRTAVVDREYPALVSLAFSRVAWRTRRGIDRAISRGDESNHFRIACDFHRAAVRRLERAGVPRSVAKKLVGHRSDAIYLRYAITNETDLGEALAKVIDAPSIVRTHLSGS